MEEGYTYRHIRRGNTLKVEIRDETRKLEYRNKISLNDKNALMNLLLVLEKYCSFSVYDLIKTFQPI